MNKYYAIVTLLHSMKYTSETVLQYEAPADVHSLEQLLPIAVDAAISAFKNNLVIEVVGVKLSS